MKEYISTRWYRPPECLLTDGYYNHKMDVWGVGCVFFEILSLFPLFPGNNEKDQIHKIHNILGTPSPDVIAYFQKHATNIDFNFPHVVGTGIAKLIPHISPECQDFISKLLIYNPDERLTTRQAVNHPYMKELRALDVRQASIQRELSPPAEDGPRQGRETVAEYPRKKARQQGRRAEGDSAADLSNEYDDSVNNVRRTIRNGGSCRRYDRSPWRLRGRRGRTTAGTRRRLSTY